MKNLPNELIIIILNNVQLRSSIGICKKWHIYLNKCKFDKAEAIETLLRYAANGCLSKMKYLTCQLDKTDMDVHKIELLQFCCSNGYLKILK